MKTLNLEVAIENDEDALVVMNLLHEHHFSSRISEKPSQILSNDELIFHLDEVMNEKGIDIDGFKKELESWR